LHDEEIGVIDVELDRLKQVLDGLLLRAVAIDQVFTRASENNLASDADLRIFFESNRGLSFVAVVKDNCDARFRYSGLSTLVDEILMPNISMSSLPGGQRIAYLEILCADRSHVRDSQNKTY
jgi:hypothetical protein